MASMSQEQRETFLAGVHVGVVSVDEPGRGPLSAPVWYDYEPGGALWFITDRDSRKGRLLEGAERISLVAQTESAPYQYVSVEGPFSVAPSDVERHLRPMARRYLGTEGGDRYVESTGGAGSREGSIVVTMTPERWLTVDYSR